MMKMDRLWRGLVLAAALAASGAAMADTDASPWVKGAHSAVRLIAGAPGPGGVLRAGVEITLDDGFKTYWRTPGSSGVPPTLDFSQSRNVKSVQVAYPAPHGFSDGTGTSWGYKHQVILPLAVMPADPAQPVDLALKLDYAVCGTLCIPVQAQAALPLSGAAASTPNDAALKAAEAGVPVKEAPGAQGTPAILAVTPLGGMRFAVKARIPTGGTGALFAEGGPGWYYETGPAKAEGGIAEFPLTLVEKPDDKTAAQGRVTLTLATPAGAVETQLPLDGKSQRP